MIASESKRRSSGKTIRESKLVYHFCFVLFQLVKHLPPSYRFLGIGNFLRVLFAKGIACSIGKDAVIEPGCHFHRGLVVGDYSGIGIRCRIAGPVTLGRYVMMGPEVVIHTQNHKHDRIDIPMCQQGYEERRPVIIEDDVWLCERAIILPGVTVGKGSIVGAGAVVAKDVPPFYIVVGNPALVVRIRDQPKLHSLKER
jgi:maltose O-acetyltransferase